MDYLQITDGVLRFGRFMAVTGGPVLYWL